MSFGTRNFSQVLIHSATSALVVHIEKWTNFPQAQAPFQHPILTLSLLLMLRLMHGIKGLYNFPCLVQVTRIPRNPMHLTFPLMKYGIGNQWMQYGRHLKNKFSSATICSLSSGSGSALMMEQLNGYMVKAIHPTEQPSFNVSCMTTCLFLHQVSLKSKMSLFGSCFGQTRLILPSSEQLLSGQSTCISETYQSIFVSSQVHTQHII